MDPDPTPPAFRPVGLLRFATGGKLANQLYYVLQAYVHGAGSRYVVRNDKWVLPLSYLGCRSLIATADEAAGGRIHVDDDPKQVIWRDFTMGDVTSFVRKFILPSDAYRKVSTEFKADQDAIAVHVRNTDYLTNAMFSGFDRTSYFSRALELACSRFVGGRIPAAIHVFSDDISAARNTHDSLFRAFSSHVVYMDRASAEDDLLRLALYRNKIILNSTFGTWAGYIGDVIFDRGTHVVVPSEQYTGRSMRCIADPSWTMVDVVRKTAASTGAKRVAVVWSTDGGNVDYMRESLASFDMECGPDVSFIVLTKRGDISFGDGLSRGVTVIDPEPVLDKIGLTQKTHTNKRFKFACMYKLAIPLLDKLLDFDVVCSVDADTVVIDPAWWKLDGRRCWSFSSLFDYPLRGCEVAGASDQWIDDMRCAHLVNRCCPDDIRDECEKRVWSVSGSSQKSYINVGVLLWNLPEIDTEFYVRRVQAFWRQSRSDPGMFRWPEQDFVNGFMRVDAGLSIRFNCINNDKYNTRYSCLVHFAGQSGKLEKMREKNNSCNSKRRIGGHSV